MKAKDLKVGVTWLIPGETDIDMCLTARAIFSVGGVDWVQDHGVICSDPAGLDMTEFKQWILNQLKAADTSIKMLSPSSNEVLTYEQGKHHLKLTPNGSCGYLYLVAWREK